MRKLTKSKGLKDFKKKALNTKALKKIKGGINDDLPEI